MHNFIKTCSTFQEKIDKECFVKNIDVLIEDIFNQCSHRKNRCDKFEYYERINQYQDDIIYLSKQFKLEKIFSQLAISSIWQLPFFYLEKEILMFNKVVIGNRSPRIVFKTWLLDNTDYYEICERRQKFEGKNLYQHPKFTLQLKKRVLQKIIKSIFNSYFDNLLEGYNSAGAIVPAQAGETKAFFIVYPTQNNRISVLFSKIADDFFLGMGGHSIVLEAIDLKSHKSFAMKYLRYTTNEDHYSTRTFCIKNEIKKLQQYGMYGNPLEGVALEQDFISIISPLKPGNAFHFMDNLNENSPYTIGHLKNAYSDMACILKELNDNGITHNDLKGDNFLYEDEGCFKFILNDFGLTLSHEEVLNIAYYRRHIKRCHLESDVIELTKQARLGNTKRCKKIIEKQDVYALGKTLLEITLNKFIEANPPNLAANKETFLTIFGSNQLYSFFEGALDPDIDQRYTFERIVQLFKGTFEEEAMQILLYQCKTHSLIGELFNEIEPVKENETKNEGVAPIDMTEFTHKLDYAAIIV
jgi:hypothetical protein